MDTLVRMMEKILHHLGCPKRFWQWGKTNIWGILSGAGFFCIHRMTIQGGPIFLFSVRHAVSQLHDAAYCTELSGLGTLKVILTVTSSSFHCLVSCFQMLSGGVDAVIGQGIAGQSACYHRNGFAKPWRFWLEGCRWVALCGEFPHFNCRRENSTCPPLVKGVLHDIPKIGRADQQAHKPIISGVFSPL